MVYPIVPFDSHVIPFIIQKCVVVGCRSPDDDSVFAAEQASAPVSVYDGYSIPIVDLDGRDDMHVVVDKEKGQYLGHPTTLLLKDGKSIVCVYPKGHGSGPVVMKVSKDGGRTWGIVCPFPNRGRRAARCRRFTGRWMLPERSAC